MKSKRSPWQGQVWWVLMVGLWWGGGSLKGCVPSGGAEGKPEVAAESSAEKTDGGQEKEPEFEGFAEGMPEAVAEAKEAEREVAAEGAAEGTAEAPPQGPHTIPIFEKTIIHSTGQTNVREAFQDFRFFHTEFEKVFLHVKLDTTCFPFEKWKDDPPPAGHNWPASCDAFDRNFEFILNPAAKEGDPPGFEVVRAITPFGGPMSFAIDITDIANFLKGGSHRMRTHIATWSDAQGKVSGSAGRWEVSAWLEVIPGPAPRKILLAKSLFDQSYTSKSGKPSAGFQLPAGATRAVIEYRATGHGGGAVGAGCIGPADEFCRRTHKVEVDGKELFSGILWRDDCQRFCTLQTQGSMQFCKENPCGSIGSVRAPRANWCPGSITQPLRLPLSSESLQKTGEQNFSYEILGVAEGGSWRISSTLLVYGD